MGVFKKLFGGGKKVSKETAETRGDHMPDLKIPVDEKFTIYFFFPPPKSFLKTPIYGVAFLSTESI